MDKFLLYHNVPFIVYFLLFYVSFIVHSMYHLDYCIIIFTNILLCKHPLT